MAIIGFLLALLLFLAMGGGIVFLIVSVIATYAVKHNEKGPEYNSNFDYTAKEIETKNINENR